MSLVAQPIESNASLQEQLIRRAWEDEQFAELLRTDPRAAIAQETGVEVPTDVEIHVHHEDAETLHLIVPQSPTLVDDSYIDFAGPACTLDPGLCDPKPKPYPKTSFCGTWSDAECIKK